MDAGEERESEESGGREGVEEEADGEEGEEMEPVAVVVGWTGEPPLGFMSRLRLRRARCCCFLCFSQIVRCEAAGFSQPSMLQQRREPESVSSSLSPRSTREQCHHWVRNTDGRDRPWGEYLIPWEEVFEASSSSECVGEAETEGGRTRGDEGVKDEAAEADDVGEVAGEEGGSFEMARLTRAFKLAAGDDVALGSTGEGTFLWAQPVSSRSTWGD